MSLRIEKEEMEVPGPQVPNRQHGSSKKTMKLILLLLNSAMMIIGNTGGPLLNRLYFLRGGNRKWLSSWLQTGGFPLVLIPLLISYLQRRKKAPDSQLYFITPNLLIASSIIGLLTGVDCYMYAYGSSYLPLSTLSLLVSTQLAFNAFFALFIVKQRFTSYSINAIFLLILGAVVLGVHSNGDKPAKETQSQYLWGFIMMIAAVVLYGFVLPLMELIYRKTNQAVTYTLVMEMQFVMGLAATAFSTVGMLVDNDFEVIPREARDFELGEEKYYLVVIMIAICWQLFMLGLMGVISCSSSLHAGVLIAAVLPIQEILSVFFFSERFSADKGMSLALSLWGSASYFYGEKKKVDREKVRSTLLPETQPTHDMTNSVIL